MKTHLFANAVPLGFQIRGNVSVRGATLKN